MSDVDLKVVLLGKEYCGKTSLVERFLNERFTGENRYQNTIGAAYGAKRVHLDADRAVAMGVWDTAGSERYEAISRIYYRGAAAAVVCYDVTDADSWSR
jgi:Ras-related protein Rab-24